MEGETMEGDDGGGPWKRRPWRGMMEGDYGGGPQRKTMEEDHGRGNHGGRPQKRGPRRGTTEGVDV